MNAEQTTQNIVVVRLDVRHDNLGEAGVVAEEYASPFVHAVDGNSLDASVAHVHGLDGDLLERLAEDGATVERAAATTGA